MLAPITGDGLIRRTGPAWAERRVAWADARPVESKVIFNTCIPRRVPIRLVPRA